MSEPVTCSHSNSCVLDTRPREKLGRVQCSEFPISFTHRRRCKCLDCGYRFTTYELTAEEVRRLLQIPGDVISGLEEFIERARKTGGVERGPGEKSEGCDK